MSATAITVSAIARLAAPLIKEIYDGAKGEAKQALEKWGAKGFANKIARKIKSIEDVRTIWSPEESISLRSFYYPCRVSYKNHQSRGVESTASLDGGNTVIEGIVGQGKSMLMRYLAVQEITKGESKRLPIFLELRKISKNCQLIDLIKKNIGLYDIKINDQIFEHLASSGKMVLLLDGFDELGSDVVRETVFDIENLSIKYPELQIIVSSRPGNEIQKLSSFKVAQIVELEPSDHKQFLKALGLGAVRIAEITNAIGDSPDNVAGLITTPLMLTLVVLVYQSEKQIPDDLPAFFDKLFYTVFTRHDKLKPGFEREHYSGLSERKLQSLFEAFCFMCLQLGNRRTLSSSQFLESFELAQDYVDGAQCDESSFKKDITKVACLMLEEGVGEVTFLHKSIAEYHAAAFIRSCDDEFAERFYLEATKDWRRWGECLSFLRSVDPYRFSKYFEIINLKKTIEIFERVITCSSGKELNSHLPVWTRGLFVKYAAGDDKSEYECSSIGTWKSRGEHIYDERLTDAISAGAFRIAPETLKIEHVSQLRSQGIQIRDESVSESQTEISIGLGDAVDEWGIDGFIAEINKGLDNLLQRLSEAESIANKLTKRTLIFDRKIKK